MTRLCAGGIAVRVLLVLALCGRAAAQCLPHAPGSSSEGGASIAVAAGASGGARVLRLSAGAWSSSMAINHVAATLLRERTGTPVEVVVDPIAFPPDVVASIDRGETHTLLETWPAAAAIASDPETTSVDVIGSLGVAARNGWYFPSYMLDEFPWLEEAATADEATAATIGDDVFDGNVFGGPASWSSEVACGEGGIFENLGLGLACDRLGGEAELVAELGERYAAGDNFLIFLWRPLQVFAQYDLTRLKLPCTDMECFAAKTCDYPETNLVKLGWAELPLFFSPLALDVLDNFVLSVEAVEEVSLAAPNNTAAGFEHAACMWAGENADVLDAMVKPDRLLAVTSVHPTTVPARGGSTLRITGTSFGQSAPGTFIAEIGNVPCTKTTWVSRTEAECVVPPGSGQHHDVRLRVGVAVATLAGVVSYEPASLHGFADAVSGAPATSAGNRASTAGARIVVVGDNFVQSALMQCRIGGRVVQATFINFTAVECVVPLLTDSGDQGQTNAIVPIAVTNDGVRWRGGTVLEHRESIVWAGGVAGLVPLDISDATAPDHLVIVDARVFEAEAAAPVTQWAVDQVNADASVLRFTELVVVRPDLSHTRELDAAGRQAAFAEMMAEVHHVHPHVLGVLGMSYSSATLPMVAASAAAAEPWLTISNSATNPSLSNSTEHPHFLRVCPSDFNVASRLVSVIRFFETAFIIHHLMDPAERAVAVIFQADDPFGAGLAGAFLDDADSAGINVGPIVSYNGQDVPSGATARHDFFVDVLRTLGDSGVKVVAYFVQRLPYGEALHGALEDAGVVEESTLFLAPSVPTAQYLQYAFVVSFADGGAEHPLRATLEAVVDDATGGSERLSYPVALYDTVYAFARAADSMIRRKRSPERSAYTDATELLELIHEESGGWPSATGYGGWSRGSNDPMFAGFVLQTTAFGVPTVVGSVTDSTVLLSSDEVNLPSGSDFNYEPPTHMTLAVAIDGPNTSDISDWHAISGLETAALFLNSCVSNGQGGEVNPSTSSRVADLELSIDVIDISDAAGGAAAALDRLRERANAHPAGQRHVLAGVVALSSGESLRLLEAAVPRNIAVLSSTASRDSLSSTADYPLFARVVSGDAYQAGAIADIVREFDWGTLATVVVAGEPYAEPLERSFVAEASALGVHVRHRVEIQQGGSVEAARASLEATKDDDVRVFALFALGGEACTIMRAAKEAGLTGEGFVWLGCDGWIHHLLCKADPEATADEIDSLIVAAQGSLGTQPVRSLGSAGDTVADIVSMSLTDPSELVTGDALVVDKLDAWRAENAALYGPGGALEGKLDLAFAASRTYDLGLVLSDTAARMIAAKHDPSRGADMLSFWRQATGVVGVSAVFSYIPDSNSPTSSELAIVNRRGSDLASFTMHESGVHTARGFLDLAGCAPGSERRDGATSCSPCEADHYKDFVGDSSCNRCPTAGAIKTTTDGRTGTTSRDECLCPAGWVAKHDAGAPDAAADEFPCSICPEGGICNRVGLMLAQVRNVPGWWRGHPNSSSFVACLTPDHCGVSGLTLPSPRGANVYQSDWAYSTPCALGYSGPLCEICVAGYGRASDGTCVSCGDRTKTLALVVLTGILVTCVIVGMAVLQLPRPKRVSSRRRAANLKLLLTMLQINGITRLYELIWPDAFTALLDLEASTSTAAVSFVAGECITGDVSVSAGIVIFETYLWLPIVFLGAAVFASAAGHIAKVVVQHRSSPMLQAMRLAASKAPRRTRLKELARQQQHSLMDMWDDLCVNALNVAVFVLYPSLVTAVLGVFDCVDVPDPESGGVRSYLRTDFKVRCDDGEYDGVAFRAILGACGYIIGVPLLYGIVLLRERRDLFHRTMGSVTRPSTPLTIVLTQDADVIATALLRVHSDEKWKAVSLNPIASRRNLTAAHADIGISDYHSRAHVLRIVRVVRSRFDAVSAEMCRAAGLKESDVIGEGIREHAVRIRRASSAISDSDIESVTDGGGAAQTARFASRRALRGRSRSVSDVGSGGAPRSVSMTDLDRHQPSTNGRDELDIRDAEAMDFHTQSFQFSIGSPVESSASPSHLHESASVSPAVSPTVTPMRRGRRAFSLTRLSSAREKERVREYRRRVGVLRRQLGLLHSVYEDAMLSALHGATTVDEVLEAAAKRVVRISGNQRRFGFIYAQYTQSAFAFELFVMILKAAMSAVAVGLRGQGEALQGAVGALLCAWALHMLLTFRPSANYSTRRKQPLYEGPAARMVRRFVDKWAHQRVKKQEKQVISEDVRHALHDLGERHALQTMPLHERLPEVVTTKMLSYVAFIITLLNLLLGTVGDSIAKRDEDGTGVVVVAVVLMLLNILALATFGAVIAADGISMVQRMCWQLEEDVEDDDSVVSVTGGGAKGLGAGPIRGLAGAANSVRGHY